MSRRDEIAARVMARTEIRDTGYKTECWLCVRPDHLELVTPKRNILRMHAANRIVCEAAE